MRCVLPVNAQMIARMSAPLIALMGCLPTDSGDDSKAVVAITQTCDGRPVDDATVLSHQLASLGYSEFGDGFEFDENAHEVVTEATRWEALVEAWGDDGGLSPDFDSDVVFVHPWVDGGCEPVFEYLLLDYDGSVRLYAWQQGRDGGCEAWFPQLDLILASGVAGQDAAFCD